MITIKYPGIQVTESTFGAVPLAIASFNAIKVTGTASRGPVGLNRNPISRHGQFQGIYGPPASSSYLYDAVRSIFSNLQQGGGGAGTVYVNRVVGDNSDTATVTLIKAGTKQVLTLVVTGTVGSSGAGNAKSVVTSAGMSGSPITVTYAVANSDTATQVAGKLRTALGLNATIAARFDIGGSGATVTLTLKVAAANDSTASFTSDNDTSTGLTPATSTISTPGVADLDVLQIDAKGPGADYNYTSSPKHGLSVTYVSGVLKVYDAGVFQAEYRDVTIAKHGAAADLINDSSALINITWLDTDNNPDAYSSATGLVGGADGDAVTSTDIAGDAEAGSGVYQFAETTLPAGVLLAPGYPQPEVATSLEEIAINYFHIAMIDSTFGIDDSGAITERDQFASPHGHSAYYYGWVQIVDPTTGAKKYIPQSPFRAAHLIRSHSQPGFLANVGAGIDYVLGGAIGIETSLMDDIAQGELNVQGINVVRNFQSFGQGFVSWSARTLSTETLFAFIQVRVILNVIAKTLLVGLRPYVLKPYDGTGRLASQIKGSINGLLHTLWQNGALFGRSPREAFLTVNVTTLSELDQGIVELEVFVKPTPVLERLGITLFRVPLNFNFKTGEVTEGELAA